MKKYIILLSLGVVLAGCSAPKEEVKENTQQQGEITEVVYGKIKSLSGNEIEIDIAKNPFDLEKEENEENTEGESIAAVAMTPAQEAGSAAAEEFKKEENKLKLEYTNETLNFIYPTGLSIVDVYTNVELKLTDLSVGTVISVTKDKETGDIIRIDVIER